MAKMKTKKTKQSKKISIDLNTLFNNDVSSKKLKKQSQKQSQKKTVKQSKTIKTISTLKKQSLDYLQKIYHLDLYKNTIASFYTLNNPMITYLLSYNDSESKKLIKNGLSYLKLVSAYKIPEIEETLKMIDTSYKLNKDLLKELKLKDIPQIVQYASEDFTRGIRAFLDARYKHLPINLSNGFVKLWEILHTFKLLEVTNHKSTNHKSTFNVFHICEAPGQMILCAEYYAKKKEPSITDYEWRANSLNPYNYEVKTKFGALKDNYKLMKNNPDKWLWGADNTGDITRVKNIKWFKNYINNKWLSKNDKIDTTMDTTMDTTIDTTTAKLDLIIGDGGIGTDTNSIYNLQKLDLAQVINVVACSSIGGSCVIKHFTSYMIDKPETIDATSFFISFIYLYYICFEDVSLFKPYTSDATSGEFYVIGKGFKGIEERDLEKLYTILNQFKVNYAIFPKEALPDTFIKQINNFLELMSNYNMKAYEKQNLLLKCYKEAKEKKDKKNKKYSEWIKINEFE